MRRGMRKGAGDFARQNLDRQRVGFVWPIEITDFNKPELRGVRFGRNRRVLNDSHVAKSPRFRAEPSTTADVVGENFALETSALAVGKQRAQVRRRVQGRNDALFAKP